MKRKSKKTRFLCTFFCLPIILGALAAAVTFPLFSMHLTENQFTKDDTGRPQTQCPKMPDPSGKAVMLLGSVNSFWHDKVSISQQKSSEYPNSYHYNTVKFFLVPSDEIQLHKWNISCSYSSPYYVHFVLYLLKGSTLNLTTTISSTSTTTTGLLNLTICTNFPCWLYLTEDYLEIKPLLVEPNKTNTTSLLFTAPHNSFYYFTSSSLSRNVNASLDFYHVDMTMSYLNYTMWSNKKESVCTSTGSTPNKCEIWIKRGGIFQAKEYAILAVPVQTDFVSQLKVKIHHRRLAYVVPGVAVGGLLLVVLIAAALFLAARHFVQRKREHHSYVM